MGADGSIHGWNALILRKSMKASVRHDEANELLKAATSQWQQNQSRSIDTRTLNIAVISWNVNETKPLWDCFNTLFSPMRELDGTCVSLLM